MHEGLVLAGAILTTVSTLAYMWAIVRGPVRPQRMTRFLLAVITALSFVSLWAGNDRTGMWLALASFGEALAVWIISLWRGMGGTDRLDWICLGLCTAGVAVWLLSGESFVGLVASLVADAIACVPSLVKTFRLPYTESAFFYALGAIAGVCVALAGPYDWQTLVFPVYIAVINAVYVMAIWRPTVVRHGMSVAAANGTTLDGEQ